MNPKVLLVDDESHVRQLIKVVLRDFQCEIVGEADNGKTAVDMYKQLEPDLVFLDINMPIKDGRETLRDIMAFDANALVVMLTSLSDTQTVRTCAELGATDYIRKDASITELRQLFQNIWEELSLG